MSGKGEGAMKRGRGLGWAAHGMACVLLCCAVLCWIAVSEPVLLLAINKKEAVGGLAQCFRGKPLLALSIYKIDTVYNN